MHLDTTVSVVALVSGLSGALLSAYLSYMVRLKVRAKDDVGRQRRLAYVYFIQLTEICASDLVVKDITKHVNEVLKEHKQSITLSNAAAIFLSQAIAKLEPKAIASLLALVTPTFAYISDSLDKVNLRATQLSELPEDCVFFYNRYMMKAQLYKGTIKVVESVLNSGDVKTLKPELLRALFDSYQGAADAAGVLRAAFITYGGISSAIATAALMRSYKIQKEDISASFSRTSELDAAKKAFEAATKGDAKAKAPSP